MVAFIQQRETDGSDITLTHESVFLLATIDSTEIIRSPSWLKSLSQSFMKASSWYHHFFANLEPISLSGF